MASSVPAELLKQLSLASDALNNVTDAFNEQIKTIEEALASYNLGVIAWVPACSAREIEYDTTGNAVGEITKEISVGYEKFQGKWCLKAASWIPEFDARNEWALRDAPREIRIQAIDGIPKLLEKLAMEATKIAGQVAKKNAEARLLAASIKPRKGNSNEKS